MLLWWNELRVYCQDGVFVCVYVWQDGCAYSAALWRVLITAVCNGPMREGTGLLPQIKV